MAISEAASEIGRGSSAIVPLGSNYLSVRLQNALWEAHQTLAGRDLLHFSDLTERELEQLLRLSQVLKEAQKTHFTHRLLAGKTIGLIFDKSSTRTRVSFEVGMLQLGGHALFLPGNQLQTGRGEPISDTAQVMSRYVDGVMIRTFRQADVETFAEYATVPVINGLTDEFHPCQLLADALTILEHMGGLRGVTVAYVGDGNNLANSWLQVAPKLGMNIRVATPPGYKPLAHVVEEAKFHAVHNHTQVLVTTDPMRAVDGADVIYTDTWVSMGDEAEAQVRLPQFERYQVNEELCKLAKPDHIFMHCLPAHRGEEVSEEVIDGEHSVIFDQAENRLHAQKAIMAALMADAGAFGEDL
ncbi:ornithine carbamoyltransferase [Alicyclobacillus acidoterrestris]|uniref:Ornithine carbamoyltransferase n=1 Tax=Alicyclobacillus acidoterrestris (strain ATCC 49025 / DSM 3922 / CIP 106132 / NCIMB 13137 / GD3B) TaxID=1356854 RepID=T0CQ63_ALIAG|nr:ornithine carbamoyltransferase [Alicyclobacillus acidoterrestris]EPZ41632.1 ornithine carbamoyltransferase [Alicyclobacillus acidoterrestris ATCC 49025]UNO50537.1 ornithine carbamoyltransferase [Alicyclobacillus acidoterrestris]